MIKFFILFVFGISFLFFSLIAFQEQSIQRHPPLPEGIDEGKIEQMIPKDEKPPEIEDPPAYIPCLAVVLLSSLFVLFLFKYLDKNFIAPLVLIENKLKEVNSGNLDVKFETESENREVKDTFKILNSMITGLSEKERLQDEFIRNLAHDLRSPVVAQERAIAILKEEFQGHELLDGLMDNSETYLKMINLIIEAHNKRDIVINKTEFNFYNLVNAVFNGLKPLACKKNIELKNNVDTGAIVFADYISMNRIVTNLISNALENIGFNKTISVSLEKDDTKTSIIVEDNGEGMDKETLDKIFNKHVSYNKSGKKAVSGLGLSIVSELVQKNGGTIKAQSEQSKYTRFIAQLPNKGTL